MLGELIQLVAVVVLLASLAYVLLLIVGNYRIQNATVLSAEEENKYYLPHLPLLLLKRTYPGGTLHHLLL